MQLPAVTADSAWQRFDSSRAGRWDLDSAAHLFRRAAFSATQAELEASVRGGLESTVEGLLAPGKDGDPFERMSAQLARAAIASREDSQLTAWWLYRMLHSPAPAWEKATLFWHGHFATSLAKVSSLELMYRQNLTLRRHAIGSFRELVHAIARDPAMMVYLDARTNRKTHPNENFARELLELFCLGIGNYSETDIKELARCFTGWELRQNSFRFNRVQHDQGDKTLFGVRRQWPGTTAIDHVLTQPSAATFIAGKLLRFYVSDDPKTCTTFAEPLAELLRKNDFELGPTLRTLFMSRLFHSPLARGRKIRSPIDFAVGTLRSLEGTVSTTRLARRLRPLGQELFRPPSVKGWEGGKHWINSMTMIGRANLVQFIMTDATSRFGGEPIAKWTSALPASPRQRVDHLLQLLVAVEMPQAVRRPLYDLAGDSDLPEIVHAISMLPEYHLA